MLMGSVDHAASGRLRPVYRAAHIQWVDDLGKRIVEAYVGAGMNRNQFAKQLGTTYPNVMRWEKGETKPKGDYLAKIAEVCSVSMEWLITGQQAETRLERDEDEVLPVAERAIVALGRTTAEERAQLRERIVQMQLRSDDPVSAYVALLERELGRIRAEAGGVAPKTADRAQAVKTELPANVAKFGRGKKGAS